MNPVTSAPRTTGILERMITGAIMLVAMKFVEKGYITGDMAAYIAAGGYTLIASAWEWWSKRPQTILDAAAKVPNPHAPDGKTVVIASPEMAAATSTEPNVKSSTDVKIVPKVQ